MLLSPSSTSLIKLWPTRGKQYHKVQGNFYEKGSQIVCAGQQRGELNMIQFHKNLVDFDVRRSEPELVRPSRPTPNKLMPLSDIDNLPVMQCQMPVILFYPVVSNMIHKDPAKVIKNALAEALVHYFPWAGRMYHQPVSQKSAVDCSTEGVVFVEADADIRLEDLGEQPMVPPFPYLHKLLYGGIDYSVGLLGTPLLTIQVTRMSCGGFILALKYSHAISDGGGIIQFLTAITEFARGTSTPSILPVWKRDLLNPRDPYHHTPNDPATPIVTPSDLVRGTVIFNASDIATLRGRIQPAATTFELIAATLWRSRLIALEFEPKEEVRLAFAVNARPAFNPPIPVGYYGNAFTVATAASPAAKIYNDVTLTYTVEQVKNAKGTTIEEYKKSLIAPGILRCLQLPLISPTHTYTISDLSHFGFSNLDFGWGNPVYAGPADNTRIPHLMSFITSFKNEMGEEVKVVPVYLPQDAMDRFDKALHNLLKGQ